MAAAGAGDALIVHLGFGGAVRVGVPVPLRVEVPPLPDGGAGAIVVDVPALGRQEGEVVTATSMPFEAVPGAARVFDIPVVLSDIRRPLVVRLVLDGRERLRRSVMIRPDLVGGRVVVELSNEAAGLETLARLPERVVTAYVRADVLPRRWQEYGTIGLLVVRGSDVSPLDDAQRDALITWVRLGGRLLVIAPPGAPPPAFLEDLIPASVGAPRVVSSAGGLVGETPPGSYTVSDLRPRPGATVTRAGGIPIGAGAREGAGWIEVWGFDPTRAPFAGWPGRVRMWSAALGPPNVPPVQVDAVAARLPAAPSLDPFVHAEVGGVVLAYLAALYLIVRRPMTRARMLASLVSIALAVGVFWRLAEDVRVRSTSVAEATFLEQAPGTPLVRALTVGAIAVPYGGRFRVRLPSGALVRPLIASGGLRVEVTDRGTLLDGTLAAGEAPRTFEATAAAPLAARADLGADDRTLRVDLGGEQAHRVELHWGDRWYWIGDVGPAGSTIDLRPDAWVRSPGTDSENRDRSWIFLGSNGDVIMSATTPVLVGEIQRIVSAFRLEDGGALDREPTILVVPVERR
ncbi:MAG TPA: hypothetical protein VEP50_07040 [bacterium]|nr:hypothetical protein [bacterium]